MSKSLEGLGPLTPQLANVGLSLATLTSQNKRAANQTANLTNLMLPQLSPKDILRELQ